MTRAPATRRACPAPSGRAGFTLIEIMVVIVIIGILMGLIAVTVSKHGQAGRVTACKARIEEVSLQLASYFDRTGDYPPSRLVRLGVTDGNGVNEGIEALVVALKSPKWSGQRPEERWLGNTDADDSKMVKLMDGSHALLEILDPWDNPLIYIASADYAEQFVYRLGVDGVTEDVTVKATMSPLTGAPNQFDSFQLLSAGPDGVLGTEDDIANYETETAAR